MCMLVCVCVCVAETLDNRSNFTYEFRIYILYILCIIRSCGWVGVDSEFMLNGCVQVICGSMQHWHYGMRPRWSREGTLGWGPVG